MVSLLAERAAVRCAKPVQVCRARTEQVRTVYSGFSSETVVNDGF